MKLIIGGGCAEHGRNCFYFTSGTHSVIVDCGKMASSDDCYPHLTPQQIQQADYLLLTHSHNDHSGALPWLLQNGFSGKLVMTAATHNQLPPSLALCRSILVDELAAPKQSLQLEPWLSITWGRTGHCAGSCWYLLSFAGRSILCSGDYIDGSPAYAVDKLRGISADLAVIDVAYAGGTQTADEMRQGFVAGLQRLQAERPLLLLPVPKYGRGLDILLTLRQALPAMPIYIDDCLATQLLQLHSHRHWLTVNALHSLQAPQWQKLDYTQPPAIGACLFCDPQIKQAASYRLITSLAGRAFAVASGHLDAGSNAARLADDGLLLNIAYPVHGTQAQLELLTKQNNFGQIVANHSALLPNSQCLEF